MFYQGILYADSGGSGKKTMNNTNNIHKKLIMTIITAKSGEKYCVQKTCTRKNL